MPLSGADCAWAGTTPGRVSAAASSVPTGARARCGSVAATTTSADPVTAGRRFLARVDVLLRLHVEPVVVELHVGPGEVPLFPGLRRFDRGAAGQRGDDEGENRDAPRKRRAR